MTQFNPLAFINGWVLLPIIIWTLFWKGLALWHAAKRGDKGWFLVMIILNTAGILEIIYLFWVAKLSCGNIWGSVKKACSPKKKE